MPLARLALTCFIDNRSLFTAYTNSNHLNLSKPPLHTKFLFKFDLVFGLDTVNDLFRLFNEIFSTNCAYSAYLIFFIFNRIK